MGTSQSLMRSGCFGGDSRRIQQYQGRQEGAGGHGHGPNPAYQPLSTTRHQYSRTSETYNSPYQVYQALLYEGLGDINIIVGIDFTKSNEQPGQRWLHELSTVQNPYEQAISIVGKTLSNFGQDNPVPFFGFGDELTRDQDVFCFYPDGGPCNGIQEALNRYRELTPNLHLDGPTSFAPIIEMAMTIVEQSGRQYHVLLIIANGQVTRNVHTTSEHLSFQEQNTIDAIVNASRLPLSIVLVGVGDVPWDMMKGFADKIPTRDFDNFHFVSFTEIMSKGMAQPRKEAAFALSVMMKLPQQYKAIMELGLLGCRPRIPLLPPPTATEVQDFDNFHNLPQSRKEAALMELLQNGAHTNLPPSSPTFDTGSNESDGRVCLECGSHRPFKPCTKCQPCNICHVNPKNMVFGCGHQVCCSCEKNVFDCPFCRAPVTTRIKIF